MIFIPPNQSFLRPGQHLRCKLHHQSRYNSLYKIWLLITPVLTHPKSTTSNISQLNSCRPIQSSPQALTSRTNTASSKSVTAHQCSCSHSCRLARDSSLNNSFRSVARGPDGSTWMKNKVFEIFIHYTSDRDKEVVITNVNRRDASASLNDTSEWV